MIEIQRFIQQHITERPHSLFYQDITDNHALLAERINYRSILVIGGAGTIGASFIKTVLLFKPSRLYVVDINENGLTELTRDLRSTTGLNIPVDYKTYPVNFGDTVFEKIYRQEGPFDIVANFAAHKHVRSEKDHYSIEAMIDNNVIRAKRLLDLLFEMPPKYFFCVSTDKAANPVNVMGASKKLMEEVILAYSAKIPVTTARFANVAFSNGSLPFGFIERLMKRQPLSAPSNVLRYFVSPEESGQICMLACILGKSGEIFFPKLEEKQMKSFSHIAEKFLEEQGYSPHYCQTEEEAKTFFTNNPPSSNLLPTTFCHSAGGQLPTAFCHPGRGQLPPYPVYFFESDTSGEKLYEEFYTESEEVDLTTFRQLGIVKNAPRKELPEIEVMFYKLQQLFKEESIDKQAVVKLLQEFIPNFEHIETGKGLDQKM